MKASKAIICILTCISILLSMAACGNSDSNTQETTSPADSYLAMAEEFVSQENYDSALDVLNQAKAQCDDPRLDDMIAKVEAERPVFLDVEYQVNSDHLKTTGVQIHEVTAQVLEETIRYDIAYTAPENMYLQVVGTDLQASWDYMTPGGKDVFSFELDKKTACNYFSNLAVLIKYSYQNYSQVNITTHWPEAPESNLVRIPVVNGSNADCSVNLATVRAVSEDMLHLHVEYTTPLDQNYYSGFSSTGGKDGTFFSVGAAPGDDMISLMISREDLANMGTLYVCLLPEDNWDNALWAELRPSDYTLPQYSPALDAKEVSIDGSEVSVESSEGKNLQLDSILVQQTPVGNLYTLKGDFSGCRTATAYCNISRLYYTITVQVTNPGEMQCFVPAEILTQTSSLGIECWADEGYIGFIPLVHDRLSVPVTVHSPEKAPEFVPEEPAPGQVVRSPIWNWRRTLTQNEVEIFNLTETVLENGNIRYALEYRATAGMHITVFNPPSGDLFKAQKEQVTSGRREVFVYEIAPSVMDQIQEITINFWSENDEGNYFLFPYKNQYHAMVTDGNPIGEEQTLKATTSGKVKVHSVKAQQLDNGCVRYTVEYTTVAGRNISFFNPPSGDQFMYLSDTLSTGGQDTYVIDILRTDNDAISEISMKFYDYAVSDQSFAFFKPARFPE